MFLRCIDTTKKIIRASSIGAQMIMIGLMVFVFVTFADAFYLATVHNEAVRFAKAAALYGVSQGRDYTISQTSDDILGTGSTANGGNGSDRDSQAYAISYVNANKERLCPDGDRSETARCQLLSYAVYVNPDGASRSFATGYGLESSAPYTDSILGLAGQNNDTYFSGGTWVTNTPAVGVLLDMEIRMPTFFMVTIHSRVFGEATVDTVQRSNETDKINLPWE